MPKASAIQSSFNAGELSPLLEGRVDIAKYASGLRRCENFIPSVQGALKRRTGTRYIAPIKEDSISRAWLIPFDVGVGNSYLIEMGPLYARFWTNHGLLRTSPTDQLPYEIATPFLFRDLFNADGTCGFQFAQQNDVLYIAHPKQYPSRITRTSPSTFSFGYIGGSNEVQAPFAAFNMASSGNPYIAQQYNPNVTVWASTDTGNVTLTASDNIFSDDMVLRGFYLEQPKNNPIKTWEPGKTIVAGDRRRSGLNNYVALNAATTGTVKPTHIDGARYDGDTGVQWLWTDDGFGVVAILGITTAQVATGFVQKRLPGSLVGTATPTTRWARSAWNPTDGYPRAVSFFYGRLCWGRDQTIWASVPDDYENQNPMEGGQTTDASALSLTIAADKNDYVKWMKAQDALIIGTASSEYAISAVSGADPFSSLNAQAKRQSTYGSNGAAPLHVNEFILFTQASGRRVRELAFDIQSNGYVAKDVTVLSEHLTVGGIVQIAYAGDPDTVLWAVRADGMLLGFTYNREQQVFAWHKQPLGGPGYVESIATIKAPDGKRDELYLIVRRWDPSGLQWRRYVEYLGDPPVAVNTPQGFPAAAYDEKPLRVWDSFYVDCGLSYDGAAQKTFTGLDHLEGQTVDVLADGAAHHKLVVKNGSIVLDDNQAAKVVHVGLPCPAKFQTMRINVGAADGTSQGKIAKLIGVSVRLFESLGGKIGYDPDAANLNPIEYHNANDLMDTAATPVTADVFLRPENNWDEQGVRVGILADQPLPMTIVAVMPQLNVQDER